MLQYFCWFSIFSSLFNPGFHVLVGTPAIAGSLVDQIADVGSEIFYVVIVCPADGRLQIVADHRGQKISGSMSVVDVALEHFQHALGDGESPKHVSRFRMIAHGNCLLIFFFGGMSTGPGIDPVPDRGGFRLTVEAP
jgi:hypothetical protein